MPRKGEIDVEDIAQHVQPGAQHRHLQGKQRFPLGDELLQGSGQDDDFGKAPQKLHHSPGDALGGHLKMLQLGDELLCRNDGADGQLAEEAAEHPVADGVIDGVTFHVVEVDEVAHRGKGGDGDAHRQHQPAQLGEDGAEDGQRDVLGDGGQQDGVRPGVCHGDGPGKEVIRDGDGQQQQKTQRREQPHEQEGVAKQEDAAAGPAQEIVKQPAGRQEHE